MANRKIITQTTVLKNNFGGWISPSASLGGAPSAALEGGTDQYTYSRGTTLFSNDKVGHIAPSPVFDSVTDTLGYITSLPINGDVASNGKAFVVLNEGALVRLTNDATTTETTQTPTSAVTKDHLYDVIVLKDLAGTPLEYALWTFETASGGDIAKLPISASGADGAIDNSFWHTTLSGTYLRVGVPHKVKLGSDGSIYITDGSGIAQLAITGAMASAVPTTDKLKVGPHWQITGITDWKGNLVFIGSPQYSASNTIPGQTRGSVRVWFWNYSDANFTSSIDIPDNYANGIYSDGTQLLAFTNGNGNQSREWKYNGTDFIQQFTTSQISPSDTPIQGGIESYQNSTILAAEVVTVGIGSNVNYYNLLRTFSMKTGMVFHGEGVITDGTYFATAVGMIKNIVYGELHVGATINGVYKILRLNHGSTTYQVNGDFRTRLIETSYKAAFKRIRAYFSQFGSGASVLFSLFRSYTPFVLNHPPTATGTALNTIHVTGLSIDTELLHIGMSVTGVNIPANTTIVAIGSYTTGGGHHGNSFDLSNATTGAVGTMTFLGSYDLLDREVTYANLGAVSEYVIQKDIVNLSSFYLNLRFDHASSSDVAAIIERLEVDWTINIQHSPYAGD